MANNWKCLEKEEEKCTGGISISEKKDHGRKKRELIHAKKKGK
jgi:hypothetical protein